jgi:hypothetical protein
MNEQNDWKIVDYLTTPLSPKLLIHIPVSNLVHGFLYNRL